MNMTTVTIRTKSDADFNRTFIYQTIGEVPISIANMNMKMSIRKNAADANVRLELATNTGEITILESGETNVGRFTITIPKTKLMELPVGTYDQSLVGITLTGAVTKIWDGTLVHSAGPSR